jgi:CheY-like chemotaxis protein
MEGGRMDNGAVKGTVLVVDDDPSIIDFLETALEEEGYLVLASVGAASLRVAHDVHPDVILLDLNMPDMDGVEVSQRLRADPVTAAIPIVVMSAREHLRATGPLMAVNDRLPKPFELARLYEMVARWTAA